MKLIWFDVSSRTLDVIATLGSHRKKSESHLSDSRIQKDVVLVPDPLILRWLSNQLSRTRQMRPAAQGKRSGGFCPDFSMHFHFLLSSYFFIQMPSFSPRKSFSLGLTDLSVVVERFPQKLCFRGLHHLCGVTNIYV